MTNAETDIIAPKPLSESVKDALIRLVATGQLRPGERLNEVHLAARFGVSRGPVREAARELEGLGFLTSSPRLGFYVATFTRDQIVDLYEVKRWIDRAIVADVRTYMDEAGRRAIRDSVERIDASAKLAFADTLLAFRQDMTDRLHNRFLAEQAMALYRKFYILTALLDVPAPEARMARILGALRRVWDALIADDAKGALAALDEDGDHWRRDVAPRFTS